MTDTNVVKDVIWPRADSDVLARVVWLYVGQRSSSLERESEEGESCQA